MQSIHASNLSFKIDSGKVLLGHKSVIHCNLSDMIGQRSPMCWLHFCSSEPTAPCNINLLDTKTKRSLRNTWVPCSLSVRKLPREMRSAICSETLLEHKRAEIFVSLNCRGFGLPHRESGGKFLLHFQQGRVSSFTKDKDTQSKGTCYLV